MGLTNGIRLTTANTLSSGSDFSQHFQIEGFSVLDKCIVPVFIIPSTEINSRNNSGKVHVVRQSNLAEILRLYNLLPGRFLTRMGAQPEDLAWGKRYPSSSSSAATQ